MRMFSFGKYLRVHESKNLIKGKIIELFFIPNNCPRQMICFSWFGVFQFIVADLILFILFKVSSTLERVRHARIKKYVQDYLYRINWAK